MSTPGYDATHINVAQIPANARVVFGYDTGTPDIKWTGGNYARFVSARKVHIDQGGLGSPVLTAHMRDVEPNAWSPESAVTETRGWNPPRPTIYCDRYDLPRVLAAGWHGDLALAIPSDLPPEKPPLVAGCTVVAVQWKFEAGMDLWVVFDDTWPERNIMTFPELQLHWRHCTKCQHLFYGPNQAESVCPKGGQCDGDTSGDYALTDAAATDTGTPSAPAT